MRLRLNLLDDHRPGAAVRHQNLIGFVLFPQSVPRIVACFTEGVRYDYACLNVVSRCHDLCDNKDVPHDGHLTRTSVLTVSKVQIEELHERGEVRIGEAIVRLLDEPVLPANMQPVEVREPVDG